MRKNIVNYFFLALFLLALYLFIKLFSPFLIPFILAVILVAVFYPWFTGINTFLKHKGIASLITCTIIVVIVILPLGILLGLLSNEALDLFVWARDKLNKNTIEEIYLNNESLVEYLASIEATFNVDLSPAKITSEIGAISKNIGLFLYAQAREVTSNLVRIIFQFILLIFILFYFFRDGNTILKKFLDISPLKASHEKHLIQTFREVGSAVFWGNLVSALLQGLAASLGFLIFGPRGSIVLIGLATAVVSLVPAVGPLLIFIPGGIYHLVNGNTGMALALIIYGVVISNVLDNIVKPKMIENKIKIHPLLVFFSILGGVQVFGILGILYGPLIVTLFLTLLNIYKSDFERG